MNTEKHRCFKTLFTITVLIMSFGSAQAQIDQLDVNDFPMPQTEQEVNELINADSLSNAEGEAVVANSDLAQIIDVAETFADVRGRNIRLVPEIKDISTWKIAGIRFDPSAPGSSQEVIDAFGSIPQIRLVMQPVTSSGFVKVHDVAIHLIYDYILGRETGSAGSVPKSIPDENASLAIVEDLLALKASCENTGIDTNVALNVHPCLQNNSANFTSDIVTFLNKHLDRRKFNSSAIMGLNNGGPEPWLFLSLVRSAPLSNFSPLPSPGLSPATSPLFSQMISFIDSPNVQPIPSNTNLMPVSSSLVIPTSQRRGVSTAPLFDNTALDSAAQIGLDALGNPVFDESIKVSDIADIIANPIHSHFFNTDCVSCHSETTRRIIRNIEQSDFAYILPDGISGLAPEVTPVNDWNVRNFGWFRNKNTISLRTANETAEAVEFIHKKF